MSCGPRWQAGSPVLVMQRLHLVASFLRLFQKICLAGIPNELALHDTYVEIELAVTG